MWEGYPGVEHMCGRDGPSPRGLALRWAHSQLGVVWEEWPVVRGSRGSLVVPQRRQCTGRRNTLFPPGHCPSYPPCQWVSLPFSYRVGSGPARLATSCTSSVLHI